MTEEVLFKTVALAQGGRAGVATLNVEKTLNSLTLNMVDLLTEKLKEWEQDADIQFVWFEGAGDRAFCAGGDIQNLYHDMKAHPGGPCPYCEDFFEREYRLDYLIHTYKKPTVVWGHGIVMGGGLGIASACDFRIGTEKTRIAMPEITIGLIPDAGATWSFMQMPENLAHFLALTGAQINGADALHVGLATHLLQHEQQEAVFNALCAEVTPEATARSIEQTLESHAGGDFPASQLKLHEAAINEVLSKALLSESPVKSFLELVDGVGEPWNSDPWLQKAVNTLRNGCPTTAQIIVEQFRRARDMDLAAMLRQEFTLAAQCSRHPDFAEGVRALLIDKDNKPEWKQSVMGSVENDWVMAHFESTWETHPLADLDSSQRT